jgi:hypothetical protein
MTTAQGEFSGTNVVAAGQVLQAMLAIAKAWLCIPSGAQAEVTG